MKWSCCEGGNVLLWENSASSARQMEDRGRGLAWVWECEAQSKQLEYYCFTHSDHILRFSPRYHLRPVSGCGPWSVLIPMCLETSLKNNTRLSSVLRALLWILCHQSFSLPPVSCECWSSILRSAHDNRVFVITWFWILSRKGMFIPFKEAISNIPKSPCSPPKWPSLARMVRYGGRVIGACDHVTRVVGPAQTRNLKEITRLMTSPGIPHWAQHAIWEPVPPRPRQQLTPSAREYLR